MWPRVRLRQSLEILFVAAHGAARGREASIPCSDEIEHSRQDATLNEPCVQESQRHCHDYQGDRRDYSKPRLQQTCATCVLAEHGSRHKVLNCGDYRASEEHLRVRKAGVKQQIEIVKDRLFLAN